jgi:hypothetical protein
MSADAAIATMKKERNNNQGKRAMRQQRKYFSSHFLSKI